MNDISINQKVKLEYRTVFMIVDPNSEEVWGTFISKDFAEKTARDFGFVNWAEAVFEMPDTLVIVMEDGRCYLVGDEVQ